MMIRASIRSFTSWPRPASHGVLHHPRPSAPGGRPAAQRGLEDAVYAEDAPGAGECEAEERQREQRPDPVPLAGHVERSERDVHLPEETADTGQTREDAEEQGHAQRELDQKSLKPEESEVGQDDVLEERGVPTERR